MTKQRSHWIGLGGVPQDDNPRALGWERRLHWIMIVVALLTIPALVLDNEAHEAVLIMVGKVIEWIIFLAFAAEFAWMFRLTSHRGEYLARNWLSLLIVVSAGANLAGFPSQWVAIARVLRLALVGLLLTRVLGSLRKLFSPSGIPFVLGLAAIIFALAGAGFYWLEPTVGSYADGVWLAFVTGSTVGYGDFVPTTTASRVFAVFMVMLGLTLFSLVTASISAFFIGEDEKLLRQEMHQDIRKVREDVMRLIGDEERARREEMHADIRQLRIEVAQLKAAIRDSARDGT